MQNFSSLFKVEDFTPYDPTQDAIFPPELMVSSSKSTTEIKTSLWLNPSKQKTTVFFYYPLLLILTQFPDLSLCMRV